MFNKLIVSAYKLMGFVILLAVLVGLGSYVVITGFYYVSSSWLTPIIISPSDKRVIELTAQLAQQQSLRDTLAVQRADIVAKRKDADRIAAAEYAYQQKLRASIGRDLESRNEAARQLRALRKELGLAQREISAANNDFAGLSRERMKEMFSAHLASKDELLRGNKELAGLTASNLALLERTVFLDQQITQASAQASSLKSLTESLGRPSASAHVVSSDALTLEREFDQSELAMTRAREASVSLTEGLAAVDASLRRYESLLQGISGSPYLTAFDKQMTVAFVPYTNMDNVKPGSPVYSCVANVVICRRVGTVRDFLEGEVVATHPVQKIELRGVMVRMDLTDRRFAQDPVLHANRAPFFF